VGSGNRQEAAEQESNLARPDIRIRGGWMNIYNQDTRCLTRYRKAGERNGAGDGIRTRDINLGKVALYQLSYSRVW
jgi:hypothetical protein